MGDHFWQPKSVRGDRFWRGDQNFRYRSYGKNVKLIYYFKAIYRFQISLFQNIYKDFLMDFMEGVRDFRSVIDPSIARDECPEKRSGYARLRAMC